MNLFQSIHLPLNLFFNTNLIIIEGNENYILVDPGANKNGEEHLELILEKLTKTPIIFLTHHHLDHWEGLKLIEKIFPDAIVYAHKNTNSRIDTKLNKINVSEGYILNPGGKLYQVMDLFGHTDGHIGLLNEKKMF